MLFKFQNRLLAFLRLNWLSLLLFVGFLGYMAWQRWPQYSLDKKWIGRTAIDFRLKDIASKEYMSQSNLEGRKVLLHFFATWCGTCMLELDTIKKIHKQMPSQDFQIVAISAEDTATLQAFQKKRKINYPILSDSEGELHGIYNVNSYPSNIWIAENGRIKDIDHGMSLLLFYKIRNWVTGSYF